MASVLSNCRSSVQTLFEELVQGHRDSEPPPCIDSPKANGRRSVPPRRPRAEPCFWEPDCGEPRLAELASALAPPDVFAQPPGANREPQPLAAVARADTTGWSSADEWPGETQSPASPAAIGDAPPRPPALSSIAPVAMPSLAVDVGERAAHTGFARTVSRLAPVSAGVLSAGAMAVAGAWGLAAAEGPSWIGVQALSATAAEPISPRAADPITASLRSDLMAEGALVAQVLIAGPAMAPPELDAAQPEHARTTASLLSASAGLGATSPRSHRAISPPRGSRSPRAWMAAARLGQASGRHVGREPASELLEPDPTPVPFDAQAARAAIQAAAGAAAGCAAPGAGTHLVPVSVTFAPSGRATAVDVGGALSGTSSGSCVARMMRSAGVPPFAGTAVTVSKTIRVP